MGFAAGFSAGYGAVASGIDMAAKFASIEEKRKENELAEKRLNNELIRKDNKEMFESGKKYIETQKKNKEAIDAATNEFEYNTAVEAYNEEAALTSTAMQTVMPMANNAMKQQMSRLDFTPRSSLQKFELQKTDGTGTESVYLPKETYAFLEPSGFTVDDLRVRDGAVFAPTGRDKGMGIPTYDYENAQPFAISHKFAAPDGESTSWIWAVPTENGKRIEGALPERVTSIQAQERNMTEVGVGDTFKNGQWLQREVDGKMEYDFVEGRYVSDKMKDGWEKYVKPSTKTESKNTQVVIKGEFDDEGNPKRKLVTPTEANKLVDSGLGHIIGEGDKETSKLQAQLDVQDKFMSGIYKIAGTNDLSSVTNPNKRKAISTKLNTRGQNFDFMSKDDRAVMQGVENAAINLENIVSKDWKDVTGIGDVLLSGLKSITGLGSDIEEEAGIKASLTNMVYSIARAQQGTGPLSQKDVDAAGKTFGNVWASNRDFAGKLFNAVDTTVKRIEAVKSHSSTNQDVFDFQYGKMYKSLKGIRDAMSQGRGTESIDWAKKESSAEQQSFKVPKGYTGVNSNTMFGKDGIGYMYEIRDGKTFIKPDGYIYKIGKDGKPKRKKIRQ